MINKWMTSYCLSDRLQQEEVLAACSVFIDKFILIEASRVDSTFLINETREELNRLALDILDAELINLLQSRNKYPITDEIWHALSSPVRVRTVSYSSSEKEIQLIHQTALEGYIPCFGSDVFMQEIITFPSGFVEIEASEIFPVNTLKGIFSKLNR